MNPKLLARRYGEAFSFYALETIGIQKCVGELRMFEKINKLCPQLSIVLRGQSISIEEKFEFIDAHLGRYFSRQILQLLKLLVEFDFSLMNQSG